MELLLDHRVHVVTHIVFLNNILVHAELFDGHFHTEVWNARICSVVRVFVVEHEFLVEIWQVQSKSILNRQLVDLAQDLYEPLIGLVQLFAL